MRTRITFGVAMATLLASIPVFADEPTPPAADAQPAAVAEAPKEKAVVEAPKEAPSTAPSVAETKTLPAAASPWGFHGGINLRTDLGTHPLRLDGGVRYGQLDFILVLDPMYFLDQQSSTDILAEWRAKNGFAPVLGWRFNTVGLIDGSQVQHNLVLGGALDTPKFWDGRMRGQAGLELAMMLVKHGGGGPVETIGFSSGRRFVDFVNFALFLRIEMGTKD
ncbi:MAG TPA: hypothetical protein PK156_05330 [Polyangium sp.]|nr:hypothetical protein [Polyangium sp.]